MAAPRTTNLQAHWKLDEGTGTTAADSTANSYDGTLAAGASWNGNGPSDFGESAAFDGGEFGDINCGRCANIESSDYTVSCWFRAPSLPSAWECFLSKNYNGTDHSWALFFDTTNKIQFVHLDSYASVASTTVVSANTWHHVAIINDDSHGTKKQRLYIDGTEEASANVATDVFGTGDLYIGRRTDTWAENFVGDVAMVRVYDAVLSDSEITDLYNETTAVSAAGIVNFMQDHILDN